MKQKKYCILTAYHKPDLILKNDIIEPIHVGRAVLKNKDDDESIKKYKWLEKNMIGDNTGDNISGKNGNYNEMTALYWAWKNYENLGNPEYIGLMHYRRHFYLNKANEKSAYYETTTVKNSDEYINKTLGLTEENLDKIFKVNDAIVTTPYYKESVYNHFKDSHNIEELDEVIEIIKKHYPTYYKSTKKYLFGHNTYFCNMFIFPRDIFFQYASFVFGVIERFVKSKKYTGGRLFVSERITGIFIQHLIDSGKKVATIPTMFMEDSITVPVAFATDLGYLNPTLVAISSMLKNAKDTTFYDIYILSPSNCAEQIQKETSFLKEKYKNFSLNVVDMKDSFSNVKMSISHITEQTYYRLKLPSILSKYDKCLYLDGDIIVNGDLAELYRNNITDHWIAGVRAPGYYYPNDWVEKHTKEIGLPSISNYVNAGVLLINLKEFRKNNLEEKMISLIPKRFSSQDQDILNLCCYDKIKILPVKYNFMTKYTKYENGAIVIEKQDRDIFGEEECKMAMESPIIIHYADKVKPWQDSSVVLYNVWQEYSKDVPAYKDRKKSKISVIIPIYNMENYLSECLDSVFAQNLDNVEVVCINDGSKDRSLEILYKYKETHKNLYIINQTNHGVAYSRNVGLDFANSEYIAFMDPDDKYPQNDILKTLYQKAKKNNAKICGGSWSEMIETPTGIIYKDEYNGMNSGYMFKTEGFVKYKDYQFDFGYQRFIFSLEMIRKCNLKFPLYTRFQDPPFFIKSMVAANEFYAIPKITYLYRIGYQGNNIFKGKKILDLTLGLIDDLRISSRNGLAHLHRLTLDRLNKTYGKVLEERTLAGNEPYLFELLIRANTAVDRKLLKKEISTMNDNYMIDPLRNVTKYFADCLKNKRIKPKKKETFVHHCFRYIKSFGIKCSFIRIFKGWKEAEDYKKEKGMKNAK